MARARRDAGARRRALRPRAAASHRVHAGRGPGARALGDRAGERARACDPPREPARARLPVDRYGPRARVARADRRGDRRGAGRDGRGAAHERVRVPGGQARGRHRGGPVRVPAAHAGRAAVHPAERRVGRRRAGAGRLRRAPDPRGGDLRGDHAPGARRRRARLPGARVRAGRQALRPERSGRHGREVPRRRRAPVAPDGGQRLGPRHLARQEGRQGHGGRAGPALHGADVGARPRLRPRHALAGRARRCLPA